MNNAANYRTGYLDALHSLEPQSDDQMYRKGYAEGTWQAMCDIDLSDVLTVDQILDMTR